MFFEGHPVAWKQSKIISKVSEHINLRGENVFFLLKTTKTTVEFICKMFVRGPEIVVTPGTVALVMLEVIKLL